LYVSMVPRLRSLRHAFSIVIINIHIGKNSMLRVFHSIGLVVLWVSLFYKLKVKGWREIDGVASGGDIKLIELR
jgi:hypothetical protein